MMAVTHNNGEEVMAIKDLLIAYDGSDAAKSATHMAVKMAEKYDAALTGAYVYWPQQYGSDVKRWISQDVLATMRDAERQAADELGQSFRELVAAIGPSRPVSWIVEPGQAGPMLARIGRFHDILMVGQFVGALRRERGALDPEDLVQRAGRPIIIVPENHDTQPFKEHAAVAWDGSKAAARALSDAMQILETKNKLDILTVETGRTRDHYAPMPERDIVAHLKRHGVEAQVVKLDASSGHVGDAILDHCKATGPDVLVMGAYGRAKFGSLIFGGVTTHILENMNVPVLMSH